MDRHYCCVCRNYRGKEVGSRKISLHSLPSEVRLRKAWIRRLRLVRKGFAPSRYTRLCSDHFDGLNGPCPDSMVPSSFPNKTFNNSSTEWLESAPGLETAVPESSMTNASIEECVQTSVHQNNRALDEMSLMFYDYCGPVAAESISSHRLTATQTDEVQLITTSTQTTESLEIFFAQKKIIQHSVSTETYTVQTCDQATQVTIPSLTFKDVKGDSEMVNFFTGLGDGDTFNSMFDALSDVHEKEYPQSKVGRPQSMTLIDQFFMVLMRLRLGLLIVDLANRFHVLKSTCAQVINKWIDILHDNLSFLVVWPSRNIIDVTMPRGFKELYPKTRVVIDCTEIFTEKPYSVAKQSQMYSHYKSHITYKGLVGITPNGVISFVSDLWSGAISDRQINIKSGLLDLCEYDDALMADKGFLISDLTTPKGIHLIIPPLKRKRQQLSLEEIQKTRRIANLRFHVERHMERVKNFRILQGIMPITISNSVNKIRKICTALTALLPPLYPHECEDDIFLESYV